MPVPVTGLCVSGYFKVALKLTFGFIEHSFLLFCNRKLLYYCVWAVGYNCGICVTLSTLGLCVLDGGDLSCSHTGVCCALRGFVQ